ncbi:hypothetical protein [Pyxidicoccus trucidator]|nr:hypothetical protein [Pyxidicoccus trucidator]
MTTGTFNPILPRHKAESAYCYKNTDGSGSCHGSMPSLYLNNGSHYANF